MPTIDEATSTALSLRRSSSPKRPYNTAANCISAPGSTAAIDEVRRHEALAFAWKPRYAFVFPYFTGVLTVRPNDGKTSLRLRGHYRPLLGFIGKVFDTMLGRFLARRTIHILLFEIAADIETQWRVFARAPQADEHTIAP